MILERQREGIAIAKKEGKYKGRKKLDVPNIDEYYHKYMTRQMNITDVARELNVSRNTVYRLFKNK